MIIIIPSIDHAVGPNKVQPIAILDYTRSDEQYTIDEIKKYANQFASDLITGGIITKLEEPVIYSLDYQMTYSYDGVQLANSLKTRFSAKINNAPSELVSLLKIKQYTSQQNLTALTQAISKVINSQIVFPIAGFVVKTLSGQEISKAVTISSTPYTPDSRRVNSFLELIGSSYEDLVMQLDLTFNIYKDLSLKGQLELLLTNKGYTVEAKFGSDKLPVISKYYPPATLTNLLGEICEDNNLLYTINNEVIRIFETKENGKPSDKIEARFCFNNEIPNTYLISNFNPTNYSNIELETELVDIELFTSISVYDDSGDINLFSNLAEIKNQSFTTSKGDVIHPYRFYVMRFQIVDSRIKTALFITATNNWILEVSKIDALFENKIYLAATSG